MSDFYWLKTSENQSLTISDSRSGRKSSKDAKLRSGEWLTSRNVEGINGVSFFSRKYEWRWSESRKLAYGSQESYDWSYPIQLTKNWSDFQWLNFPRWSEIFSMKNSIWSRRAMSSGSTNTESKTKGFMSDTVALYHTSTYILTYG